MMSRELYAARWLALFSGVTRLFVRPDASQSDPDPVVIVHPRTRDSKMLIPERPMSEREAAEWAAHCRLIDDIDRRGPLPGGFGDWQ